MTAMENECTARISILTQEYIEIYVVAWIPHYLLEGNVYNSCPYPQHTYISWDTTGVL